MLAATQRTWVMPAATRLFLDTAPPMEPKKTPGAISTGVLSEAAYLLTMAHFMSNWILCMRAEGMR